MTRWAHEVRGLAREHILMVMGLMAALPRPIGPHGSADPEDLEIRAEYLMTLGTIVDGQVLKAGRDLNDKMHRKFDLVDFSRLLTGALECDAVSKIRNRAERMRELMGRMEEEC